MRYLPVVLLLLLVPTIGMAEDEAAGLRAGARSAATEALDAETLPVAAQGAWHAGRLGFRELEPRLIDHLRVQAALPVEKRSWAFVQVLLDALFRIEAVPPSDVLLPHLGTHQETVVALLSQGRAAYAEELLNLYGKFSSHRGFLPWLAVGHALARAHAKRFMPVLLPGVRVRHEIVVQSPSRTGASSACPPPRVDRWTESHPIPEGFPPVSVLHFRTRGRTGLLGTLPGVYLERTEHEGKLLTIEREILGTASRLGPRLRMLDVMLAGAGVGPKRSLYAERRRHILYAGPTPFREWVRPHRERLLSGWWVRVVSLRRGGFIDEAKAVELAASVDLILIDARRGRHSSLSLPKVRTEDPFRPRKPRYEGAL